MRKAPTFLRVVEPKKVFKKVAPQDFAAADWQTTLFTAKSPHLLIFINLNKLAEQDFLTTVATAQARYVIDLRIAPRFDIGKLSRRTAFASFAAVGAIYFDLSGSLGASRATDEVVQPSPIASYLRSTIFDQKVGIHGPVIFLVDDSQWTEDFISSLAEELDAVDDIGWEILKLPYAQAAAESGDELNPGHIRRLIFISHANPDDNEFAKWLGIRLTLAGYEIWSDVTGLLGGEHFWDNIEEAIRDRSVKFIVALSRISQLRGGVLDEVAVAVATERTKSLPNFVVPLKIDDLPYSMVRANLARKNIIDFSNNWALGLSRLLQLLERDGVPRNKTPGATQVTKWSSHLRSTQTNVIERPEKLVSNWLLVHALPPKLNFLQTSASIDQLNNLMKLLDVPYFRYLRLIGTFASAFEIQSKINSAVEVSTAYEVDCETFLSGRSPDLPGLRTQDAHKHVVSIMRQAWNTRAKLLGLQPYEMASGVIAWFPPVGFLPSNRVSFIDPYGIKRRKNLIGFSAKRRVYWHVALEMRPTSAKPSKFIVKLHVVFSEDGLHPIESSSRMHVLRRSFCRNWWNDRWRDLTLAFVAFISGDASVISFNVAEDKFIVINGALLTFSSLVSIDERDDTSAALDDIIEDPEEDFDESSFEQLLPVEDV